MKVMGKSYNHGFSTDANAAIFFTIPEELDVVRFKAMAAADANMYEDKDNCYRISPDLRRR